MPEALGTTTGVGCHDSPSQCSAHGEPAEPLAWVPTTHTSLGVSASASSRIAPRFSGLSPSEGRNEQAPRSLASMRTAGTAIARMTSAPAANARNRSELISSERTDAVRVTSTHVRTGRRHERNRRAASSIPPRMVEAQRMAPSPTVEHHEAFAPSGWLAGVCAFAVYLVASTITYAGSTIAHLSSEYIPRQDASDSEFFRWALTWAPWAVTHGRDPLFTDVLYAPHGASLVWTTAVPGPALAMWPVTAAFGPLVSYNVLSLLAPTLAGWGAYLLCLRVSHRFWPSLLGGSVFGFSAYMTIQLNHPNLALTFPIPIAVYLTVRRVEGSLGRIAYIALLSLTLLALWSISIEVFATTTMFAGIAYLIALAVAWTDRRALIAALPWIAIAYVIVIALVLFPYLLPALREAPTSVSIDPEKKYVDLMRFILPRDRQLVGEGWLMARTAGAVDPDSSGVGFIGIGLVAMIVGYAITERRRRETWGILAFLLIAATLTLGP